MDAPFLEIRNVTKLFSKVVANRDVSFSINTGEVVALLGENGAGKSTIMKILYGLYHADSGKILINGKEQRIESPKDAMAQGISMIQQSFSLVGAHTVAENIILGSVKGIIDRRTCERKIQDLALTYGFDIDPAAVVNDLPVGVQQKVEILKALYQNARMLIMDEPTAVLTPQEALSLMDFVRRYAAAGNSAIFITHKLKEVMAVADRIIVMRSGEVRGAVPRSGTDEKELSMMMIGRDLPPLPDIPALSPRTRTRLRLEGVSVRDRHGIQRLREVSFSVREGEILGIAGVSGNGQRELCEAICGSRLLTSGRIMLDDLDITSLSIRERIDLGIGYVPADRQKDGMIMEMTLAENMILKSSFDAAWRKAIFLDRVRVNEYAKSTDYQVFDKDAGARSCRKGVVRRQPAKSSRGARSRQGDQAHTVRSANSGARSRSHRLCAQSDPG